jgi:hypothetical protein
MIEMGAGVCGRIPSVLPDVKGRLSCRPLIALKPVGRFARFRPHLGLRASEFRVFVVGFDWGACPGRCSFLIRSEVTHPPTLLIATVATCCRVGGVAPPRWKACVGAGLRPRRVASTTREALACPPLLNREAKENSRPGGAVEPRRRERGERSDANTDERAFGRGRMRARPLHLRGVPMHFAAVRGHCRACQGCRYE